MVAVGWVVFGTLTATIVWMMVHLFKMIRRLAPSPDGTRWHRSRIDAVDARLNGRIDALSARIDAIVDKGSIF